MKKFYNKDHFSKTFYHFTSEDRLENIMKEGLFAGTYGPDYDEPRLYLTDDRDYSSHAEVCLEIDWNDEVMDYLEENEHVIEVIGHDYTIYIRSKYSDVPIIPPEFLKLCK